jgi:hypothetical protein
MKRSALSKFRSQTKNQLGKTHLSLSLLIAAIIMLILPSIGQQTANAQISTGSISGTVVDAQGGVVADVTVKATLVATNQESCHGARLLAAQAG